MDVSQIVSIAVFVVVMFAIMTEKLHRSLAAIVRRHAGAGSATCCRSTRAMEHIDFNTLGVLLGMMLFVSVVKLSGMFEFLAIKAARLAKGEPWKVMLLFVLLTAVLSAFLDNVTTVLLIGPMTLTVCKLLDVNPIPFFMTEILASNIGGTATLIGDPPNIMIGSAAGFTFFDFILYDAPAVVVILAAVLVVFYFLYGRKMQVNEEHRARIMELDRARHDQEQASAEAELRHDRPGGCGLHGARRAGAGVDASSRSAQPALSCSSRARASRRRSRTWSGPRSHSSPACSSSWAPWPRRASSRCWRTRSSTSTGGNVFVTMLVLLIGSAVISSFLDNIPFVATMIPILLAMESSGMDVTPLWWAVSLGACLGGNGTLIGASANVVLSDISKKNGHEITFVQFLKTGFPIMLLTVAIAGLYLVVRFPPA